ncbi:hypothetical protein NPIL_629251, partial [Nephila pilipes]
MSRRKLFGCLVNNIIHINMLARPCARLVD